VAWKKDDTEHARVKNLLQDRHDVNLDDDLNKPQPPTDVTPKDKLEALKKEQPRRLCLPCCEPRTKTTCFFRRRRHRPMHHISRAVGQCSRVSRAKKKGVQHIRQLQTELKSRLANLSRGPSGHRYDKGIYDLAVTIDLGLGWQGRLQRSARADPQLAALHVDD
jgi:hypothetical protein